MTVIDLDDECGCDFDCGCYDYEEPFDWDEFAAKVNDDIKDAGWKLGKARYSWPPLPNKARPPMWWVLLTPPPPGLTIRDEYEPLETYSYSYRFPIRAPVCTIYLELPDKRITGYRYGHRGWPEYPAPKRWLIKGYQIKRADDDSPYYLDSVLAYQPPDFGWWMPTLKEPW